MDIEHDQKVGTNPVSLRLSPDVTRRFNAVAKEFGYTQNQAVDSLLANFELQQAKSLIPERQKEIEEFEQHVRRMNEIYLNSLEVNRNTENFVRQEYSLKLETQQSLINAQQQKNDELKVALDEATEAAKTAGKALQEAEKKLTNAEAAAATQNQLIVEYKEKNDTLSGLLAKSSAAVEEAAATKQAFADLTAEFNEFKAMTKANVIAADLAHEKRISEIERAAEIAANNAVVEAAAAQNAHEKQIAELERAAERKIEKLEADLGHEREHAEVELSKRENKLIAEHQSTVQAIRDEANAKIAELLEKLQKVTESIKPKAKVPINTKS